MATAASNVVITAGSTVASLSIGSVATPQTVGSGFTVTITAKDSFGNVANNSADSIHLGLSAGSPQSTFSNNGNTTMTATLSSGVATFSGVTFDTAGTTYALTAADVTVSVSAPNSNTFTEKALSTVSSLAISAISTPQTAGSGFTVTATSKDQFGNVTTNSSDSVTLSIVSGSAQTTFSNNGNTTMTATLSSGIATFSGVTFNTAGSYTLGAKDTTQNVTAPNSNTFTVAATTASKLVFTTAPSGSQTVTATAGIGPYVLTLEDSFGNAVTNAGSAATITLNTTSSGTTGHTPFFTPTSGGSSASTITIANGASTTGNFYYSDTKANTSSTLSASGTVNGQGVASSPNASVTTVAGTATQLAFTTQPSNVFAGSTMSPGVVVQLEDGFGNTVSQSGSTVTLGLSAGSIASGASTTTNASGVASFPSVVIDTAGAGLTMSASSGAASGTSAAFNVTVLVSNSLNALTDTAADTGSGMHTVSYYYCPGLTGTCTSGTPWTLIGTTSSSGGSWSVSWTGQPTNGSYQVVAVGTDNVGNVSVPSAGVPVTVSNTVGHDECGQPGRYNYRDAQRLGERRRRHRHRQVLLLHHPVARDDLLGRHRRVGHPGYC